MFGARFLAGLAIVCAIGSASAKGLYEKDSLVEKLNELNFKTVSSPFLSNYITLCPCSPSSRSSLCTLQPDSVRSCPFALKRARASLFVWADPQRGTAPGCIGSRIVSVRA